MNPYRGKRVESVGSGGAGRGGGLWYEVGGSSLMGTESAWGQGEGWIAMEWMEGWGVVERR